MGERKTTVRILSSLRNVVYYSSSSFRILFIKALKINITTHTHIILESVNIMYIYVCACIYIYIILKRNLKKELSAMIYFMIF